jgi:two-component system, chemotaxis family, sensor kinase CheA
MLERMSSATMALEIAPDDKDAVAAIFREAHTMKGTAGMVGLMGMSHLAHSLEDLLSSLRSGESRATPELTDGLLHMLDRLAHLVERAAAGESDPRDPDLVDRRAVEPEPELVAAIAGFRLHPEPHAATAPQLAPPVVAVNRRRSDGATLEVPVTRIDELNRLVGEASAAQLRVGSVLGVEMSVDPDSVNEYRDLTNVINRLQEVTERTRMVPVGTLAPLLHRTVRDTARTAGKNVRWEIQGEDIEVDRGVLEQLVAPLQHLVRNAVGHGVEIPAARAASGKPAQAVVSLRVSQVGSRVVIAIADDGAGLDVGALRAAALLRGVDVAGLSDDDALHLIFRSGVSTAKRLTEVSGRGVGLDVVSTAVVAVRGQFEIDNRPGSGCEFRIIVPITLTVVACLIVSAGGQSFALPMDRIIRLLEPQPIQVVSGNNFAVIDGAAVPVSDLATLIGRPSSAAEGPWVLVDALPRPRVMQVDAVLQKRDVVVRGLQGHLRDLSVISGASVQPNGSVLLVLDVPSLLERATMNLEPVAPSKGESKTPARARSILVVDDSLMVRELQRSMLERAGYSVTTASDGVEALAMLNETPADLLITDIEMPNMDGFQLLREVRGHSRLANIPVLIVTSRTSLDDQKRGLEAGADAYIVKAAFDEAGLLGAVSRLLGMLPDGHGSRR